MYVQLFHLNCIEKDLYISIKLKLLEVYWRDLKSFYQLYRNKH